MRIYSTDDDELPIMDIASALDRAEQTDLSTTFTTKEIHMATKKSAPAAAPAEKPAKKTKAAAPEKEESAGTPRAVPEGHVSLADVAESLGITPAAARRKLRSSETPFKAEGQHGYYWKEGSKDLAAVKKFLTPAKEETAA